MAQIPWRIPWVRSDMLPDMSDTDLELLARYTRQHAEDAFAEIVRRHLGLVYSAALRQVRSPQLAEEVAQSAFIDLARSATRLKPNTILTAWLYQVTRRTAIDVVRREASRQLREQIATEMNAMNATAADWTHIEPLLDEAMHALDDTDRTAVLLRYFENKSLREVGATLGTSENAAQKRLGRAVERLREFFAKRGVIVGASGLAMVISANAIQAAPVGLAITISTAAVLAGTTIATTATASVTKAIAMSTLPNTLTTVIAFVSVVTTLVIQHQSKREMRRVDLLSKQQAIDLAGLQSENQRLSNFAAFAGRPPASRADELQKLRDDVAALRRQTNGLAALREEPRRLERSLGKARQSQDTNSLPTVWSEEAMAKSSYAGKLGLAILGYASDHQNQFPTNFEQVAKLVSAEIGTETNFTMAQFEIVYHGSRTALGKYANPGSILIIREKVPWKNTDGRWAKTYVFSDGGRTVYSVVDGNFDAWEKQHIIPAEAPKE